ncbi:hypothetical protein MHK_006599 [Candidatus Magnetomorum sp. HK-1]|nr:hypothetical protein MHK_006599 [Candidatus Magnetomorum sp. HK-1]
MAIENNVLISITEVSRRRIVPILNRVLTRNKFSLHVKKHEQLTQFILSKLPPDRIIDESDRNLYYHISKLIDSESAIKIIDDPGGRLMAKKRSNYDIRHKETIRFFMREYFELFFPKLAEKMNFETAQFLDKELIALFGDSDQIEQLKIADSLIMIEINLDRFKEWVMIHWEVQGTKQRYFEERMFHIFCGIYYQFRRKVFPIAMFIDPHQWRKPISETFSMDVMNYPVIEKFSYQMIKLKKYDSDDFEKKAPDNPLTWGYLPLTNYPQQNRPLIKAKAINGIIKTASNDKQKAILSSLIDTSLPLTKEEHRQYLKLIEKDAQYKEVKMFDTVEEYFHEKGREKGLEEGLQEGRYDIISKFIRSGMLSVEQIVQATGEQYDLVQKIASQVSK